MQEERERESVCWGGVGVGKGAGEGEGSGIYCAGLGRTRLGWVSVDAVGRILGGAMH